MPRYQLLCPSCEQQFYRCESSLYYHGEIRPHRLFFHIDNTICFVETSLDRATGQELRQNKRIKEMGDVEWGMVDRKRKWVPEGLYRLFSYHSPVPFMRCLALREPWRTILHDKLPRIK